MDKEKIMQYQLFEQQIQALDQNIQNIESNLEEINKITTTLDEFKELKKGDKILVPISNGIFAKATLDDVTSLRMNVGSNIVVKKDPDSAKKMMEEQIKELEQYKDEAVAQYSDMQVKFHTLQQELIAEQAKEEDKK